MTSDWWAGKRGVRGFRRGGRPGGGGGIIFALARRFFSATAALLGKGAVAKWSGRALQKLEAPVQFRPAPPIYQSPPGGGGAERARAPRPPGRRSSRFGRAGQEVLPTRMLAGFRETNRRAGPFAPEPGKGCAGRHILSGPRRRAAGRALTPPLPRWKKHRQVLARGLRCRPGCGWTLPGALVRRVWLQHPATSPDPSSYQTFRARSSRPGEVLLQVWRDRDRRELRRHGCGRMKNGRRGLIGYDPGLLRASGRGEGGAVALSGLGCFLAKGWEGLTPKGS